MTSLLQTFTNIKRQELLATFVAGLFFFFILSALMVVRPAREALGMQRGIEAIRWLFMATLLVTLLVNPLFSLLVSRFRRLVFITATYSFFSLGLLFFYGLLTLTPAHIGAVSGQVFYVWFSVFNLFATMLFWALMSDRFSKEQSQRLFAAISLGGTLGAMFGPWLASVLAKPYGTPLLLLIAAGFLMCAVASAWWLTHIKNENPQRNNEEPDADHAIIGGSAWEGFSAVIRSPYLLGISVYVLILAIVATLLYFTRLQMVAALALDTDTRTQAFAQIDLYTQAATFVLQAFLTSHLIKRFGIAFTLALLPLTVAFGFIGLALLGSLAALIAFEASFRAVQRGIMRPARETLFTTVPRAERYKAKAFIDTFVYRTGDALGSQTEGMLGRLGMGLAGLAWFAVPLAVIWMSLGLWLGYTQAKRTDPNATPSL
ncbi:NTP/NDP exchange transporter [Zwartia panacis]|uniref:NTP/NDP exchange transporter n=1 Tax=Zwartia panacis TaxID=2683345 RepID=UPI0025B4575B|nr:MFS transporter [Zwartia panacis]MDN4017954.1 MFS transporter [Zwartia panacis]